MIPPFNIPVYPGVPIPAYVADQYYVEEEAAAGPIIEAFKSAIAAQGDVTGAKRLRVGLSFR